MLPLETLLAARRLLSAPGAWTVGTYAKNSKGFDVLPGDEAATCWCALGAIYRATQCSPDERTNDPDVVDAAEALVIAGGLPPGDRRSNNSPTVVVFRWNDEPGRTQDEILALFDRAIEATAKRHHAQGLPSVEPVR